VAKSLGVLIGLQLQTIAALATQPSLASRGASFQLLTTFPSPTTAFPRGHAVVTALF